MQVSLLWLLMVKKNSCEQLSCCHQLISLQSHVCLIWSSLMEKRAAQSVKMKGRRWAVADYTESGPILPTWYWGHINLWSNQFAKSFRAESQQVLITQFIRSLGKKIKLLLYHSDLEQSWAILYVWKLFMKISLLTMSS